jgi:hypothetical protein
MSDLEKLSQKKKTINEKEKKSKKTPKRKTTEVKLGKFFTKIFLVEKNAKKKKK